jgi:hypothetical protein
LRDEPHNHRTLGEGGHPPITNREPRKGERAR